MESYYRPTYYQNRPYASKFTPEDDLFLVSWLARQNADGLGRRGMKTYTDLVQQHPTGTDIKPTSWRGRYIQNTDYFDPLIRQYIIENLGAETTGSGATDVPPEIQPFTDEDEALLLDYLARHADRKAKSLFGRKMYQRLSNNVGGKWPWGVKHSWYEWRNYYKTNSEKLDKLIEQYRLANDIILGNAPRSPLTRQLPTEEDYVLSGFIAEKKTQGATSGNKLIYRALVEDQEGKWPWGKQRTAEQWRSRYYQRKELLDLLIKEKLAEIAHQSDVGIDATISKSPKARRRRKSIQSHNSSFDLLEDSRTNGETSALIAGPLMMEEEIGTPADLESTPPPPSSPVTSLVFAKGESDSWPQEITSGISSSRYSEPPETSDPLSAAATTAVTQIPIYGLFTRHDDTVLLKYMVERSLDEKRRKKKRVGDLFEGIQVFQELTETVPAAGRHTAQAWRTRYLKNRMQFDRLVNQLKGPVERARRQMSSQAPASVSDSPHGIKRQIGDGGMHMSEEGGHTKRIKSPDKGKSNSGKGKQADHKSSDGVKSASEADAEEEGEVANYLCDLNGF